MQLTSTMKHHKHSICIYTYLNVFLSTTFIWHHLLLKASFLCICMCKQCVFLHCMLLDLFKILYCFFIFWICARIHLKRFIFVCASICYILDSGLVDAWRPPCGSTHFLSQASFGDRLSTSPPVIQFTHFAHLHLAVIQLTHFAHSCDIIYTVREHLL